MCESPSRAEGRRLVLTIPGVPVAKGRPRLSTHGGFARAYTPSKTRHYEDMIRLEAGRAMTGQALLEGALSADITVSLPIPKSFSRRKTEDAEAGRVRPTSRPDVDNFAKSIDGLNGIVFRDDAQIVELHVAKFYAARPALVLTISEVRG